ncbi:hypothetical protein HDU98_006445 [Podochytrium sp. JEL0797]|nr:hypothetical protein HDU98_006445 [Podochytrium sp. JEL0797]
MTTITPPPLTPSQQRITQQPKLDPKLIRAIVERLLDTTPEDPPVTAFKSEIASFSGKPAVNSGASIAVRDETALPPFHAQINHIVKELKMAKSQAQPGRPILFEGPPGLGKGTALRQYVSEEGASRPAVYLQLSTLLRKPHGSSSLDEDDNDPDSPLTTPSSAYTETETEMEGQQTVPLTVNRNAWIQAVKYALGWRDEEAGSDGVRDEDPEVELMQLEDGSVNYRATLLQRQLRLAHLNAAKSEFDKRPFLHLAHSLRLIAQRSKAGPVVLIIDDIQLLFRNRVALVDKYDGIAEVFEWLLRCEVEGILEVTFCSSEKSAVAGIKMLRGYDYAIKLYSIESVPDETVIQYLLTQVNPCIQDPHRHFTPETAALFVATFDGSLLELDLYLRDTLTVQPFIVKRQHSFHRRLLRHLPTPPPSTSSQPSSSRSSLSSNPYLSSHTPHLPPALTPIQELSQLFLEVMMKGGVLRVAALDVDKMRVVETLVERNILRWRDVRARRREVGRVGRNAGKGVVNGGGGAGRVLGDVSRGVGKSGAGGGASQGWFSGLSGAGSGGWGEVDGGEGKGDGEEGLEDWSALSHSGDTSAVAAGVTDDSMAEDVVAVPASEIPFENEWENATSGDSGVDEAMVRQMDAAEQLALFAMEDAELVWSNRLVQSVCEGFVSGGQMQW